MVFGKRGGGFSRDRFVVWIMSVFVGLMLLLTLGGCGSGSGGGNNNNNNNNGNSQATTGVITGRVVNQNNNNGAVANATVSFAGVSTTTDNSGNFSLTVPANQAGNLTVVGPNNADGSAGYYNTGYVGSQPYTITTSGVPLAAIAPGATTDVGTIIIFSTTGPPPPPIF